MSTETLRPKGRKHRRWLRFSLAGLLFLVFCVSGFMAGRYYGYGVGYREGKDYRGSEDFFVVTYDVTDLIKVSPPGPRYVPNPDGGQRGGVGFGGSMIAVPPPADAPPEPDFDSFIDMIIETIETASWSDVGGPASIREYMHPDGRNMVVVRQNAFGHEEIAKLFTELREDDAARASNQDE